LAIIRGMSDEDILHRHAHARHGHGRVAAQQSTTFRDASGRAIGTVTTDSNGMKTFRDSMGRTTGTATIDSNGTTTFRDSMGRITGTASTPRR
jgi:hypothetical protein